MASESPTRIASTPAASTVRAEGASYAVTITIGGSAPLRASRPGAVMRVVEEAMPATSCVQGTNGSRRCHQGTGAGAGEPGPTESARVQPAMERLAPQVLPATAETDLD